MSSGWQAERTTAGPPGGSKRESAESQRLDPAGLERDLASVRLPLNEASTLPGRFYHDPAIYEAETGRIFSTMWLCVGRDEDLPRPGDYQQPQGSILWRARALRKL